MAQATSYRPVYQSIKDAAGRVMKDYLKTDVDRLSSAIYKGIDAKLKEEYNSSPFRNGGQFFTDMMMQYVDKTVDGLSAEISKDIGERLKQEYQKHSLTMSQAKAYFSTGYIKERLNLEKTTTAEDLGIGRNTLHRKMVEYGIEPLRKTKQFNGDYLKNAYDFNYALDKSVVHDIAKKALGGYKDNPIEGFVRPALEQMAQKLSDELACLEIASPEKRIMDYLRPQGYKESLREFQSLYTAYVYEKNGRDAEKAAEELQVSERTVRNHVSQLDEGQMGFVTTLLEPVEEYKVDVPDRMPKDSIRKTDKDVETKDELPKPLPTIIREKVSCEERFLR